jgi:hypothetical protein
MPAVYLQAGNAPKRSRKPADCEVLPTNCGFDVAVAAPWSSAQVARKMILGQPPTRDRLRAVFLFSSARLRDCHGRPMRNVPVRRDHSEDYKNEKRSGESRENIAHIHQCTSCETFRPSCVELQTSTIEESTALRPLFCCVHRVDSTPAGGGMLLDSDFWSSSDGRLSATDVSRLCNRSLDNPA